MGRGNRDGLTRYGELLVRVPPYWRAVAYYLILLPYLAYAVLIGAVRGLAEGAVCWRSSKKHIDAVADRRVVDSWTDRMV